jgi:hypothetical protein
MSTQKRRSTAKLIPERASHWHPDSRKASSKGISNSVYTSKKVVTCHFHANYQKSIFTAAACTNFQRAWIRAMVSSVHICHNISELTKSQQNFLWPLGSMHFFFRCFCREDTKRSKLIFFSTLLTCEPQHPKVKKEKFNAHLPVFSNSHSCSLKRCCQFRNNPKRSDGYRSTSVLIRPRW